MKILETSRLLLRHLQPEDLDELFAFNIDPDVARYIPDAPRTLAETREQLEWFQNGHPRDPRLGLWATVHKETGKFIGRCGLLPWTIEDIQEVEVAYGLCKEYWGQGLGTEAAQGILQYAFEQLGLQRLVCLIDAEHLASIKVATNMGMSFEKEGQDEIGPFHLYSINKPAMSSDGIDLKQT
jgi:ribosomal-protein-alanine N-acetyltransferase